MVSIIHDVSFPRIIFNSEIFEKVVGDVRQLKSIMHILCRTRCKKIMDEFEILYCISGYHSIKTFGWKSSEKHWCARESQQMRRTDT